MIFDSQVNPTIAHFDIEMNRMPIQKTRSCTHSYFSFAFFLGKDESGLPFTNMPVFKISLVEAGLCFGFLFVILQSPELQ